MEGLRTELASNWRHLTAWLNALNGRVNGIEGVIPVASFYHNASISGVTAGATSTDVVNITSGGFTNTDKMLISIVGNANNQYSLRSIWAYHSLTTSSITVTAWGESGITGSGGAFYRLMIVQFA